MHNVTLTFAFALSLPLAAIAAGGDTSSPPKPTDTTQTCENGQVWDATTSRCVDPQESRLDDDTLYGAVREFAYAGQYTHAQVALAAMSDQSDDRVLTYWGFTHRKIGDVPTGMAYYRQAIARNPNNFLARSYMGQALVEQGNLSAAKAQLAAIQTKGGEGTWAEESLARAISTGTTYRY